jgi:hypothetical protein
MEDIKDILLTALWQDPNYEIHQVSCPEINLENIDPIFYGTLMRQTVAAGAQFNGTKVSISGCEFDWNYDAETQTLHCTCTKKPWDATCGIVESRIRDLVAKARGAI